MLILDLFEQFPDEKACKKHLRDMRESLGICCKQCKRFHHYWLEAKEQWQCGHCSFRTTLKSGTIFQNTKMPLRVWFFTMGFMTMTKKGFSSKEIQSQIGHKRYEPIWFMMHKIRKYMGKSNDHINDLCTKTSVNLLHVLLETETKKPKFCNVPIQVYSSRPAVSKGDMIPIIQLKKMMFKKVKSQRGNSMWPTYPIKNFEKIVNGIHHQVKDIYLQNYLDEFSFKFSRRFSKTQMFHSLLYTSVQPYW